MKNTVKKISAIAVFVMIMAAVMAVSAFAADQYVDVYDDSVVINGGGYAGSSYYDYNTGTQYIDVYDDNYYYNGSTYYNPYEKTEYIDVYDDSVVISGNGYYYNGNYYYNPYYNQNQYTYTAPKTYNAVVVKNPTGETVNAGGTALFIAGATNVQSMTWKLVSPDGQTVIDLPQGVYENKVSAVSAQGAQFFGTLYVKSLIDGNGYYELELSSINGEANGWSVMAQFVGQDGGIVNTSNAVVTVR